MIEKLPECRSVRVEFQEGWSQTAKKTLLAFANTIGGDLYLGVTDDGITKGLSKKAVTVISRTVQEFCRSEVEPVLIDMVSTKVISAGNCTYVLRVSVDPGEDRPYALKGKRYTGGAYVRDGSMSVTATEEEIRDMIRDMIREMESQLGVFRLSRQTDLRFGETADIFKKYNVSFSPAHYLRLGLADDADHFTQLGELLSDQNRTKLVVGTFSQDSASLSVREFSGSLLRQIDQAFAMFAAINPELIHKTGELANKRHFAWPPKALREALVNCAVHCDYSQSEPTKVSIFPNRFEFLSYGSIPGRLSVDDIVLEGVSKCRNERLADILRRLGWMENYGSGFPMIWREYANSGAEPKLEATRRVFRIVLPKILDEPRGTTTERCRALFETRETLSMTEIMNLLNVSRTSANTAVNALLKVGQIEKIGIGRMTKYRSLLR